jgi:hypothetical protein
VLDAAKKGTEWIGAHKETFTNGKRFSTDVRLVILERNGVSFKGEYWIIDGSHGLEVKGSISDKGKIEFTPTKKIKGNGWVKTILDTKWSGSLTGNKMSVTGEKAKEFTLEDTMSLKE